MFKNWPIYFGILAAAFVIYILIDKGVFARMFAQTPAAGAGITTNVPAGTPAVAA